MLLIYIYIYRVKNFHSYDIIIDESTDKNVPGHLIVFVIIIDDGVLMIVFLGLLDIAVEKNGTIIFECLANHLKIWIVGLCKYMAFGSDGASTMVGSYSGVARILKNNLNPFFLSCDCISHKTNLAALDASKISDCKVISDEVNTILNAIVSYFNISSKRKHILITLQTIFFYANKIIKRYHKIRRLSKWQAVTTLCDSLESDLGVIDLENLLAHLGHDRSPEGSNSLPSLM